MPQVTGPRPYNIDHLLGGGARILISQHDVALPPIPDALEDIIANTSPYAAVSPWVDIGATREGTSYSRDITASGYEIQQATGSVLEEVTEVARTINVSFAEVRKEHLRILEETAAVEQVAETPTNNLQDLIKFGSFTDLTHHRLVAIGLRSRQSGTVKESASVTRGRFLALVLYDVAIAADTSEVPMEKGTLTELPIGFKSYPAGGQTAGVEHGVWIDEHAGDFTV